MMEGGTRRDVDAVEFSRDGRMVLSHFRFSHSDRSDGAKVWDVLRGALLVSVPETNPRYAYSCFSFSPCNSYIAWASRSLYYCEDSDKTVFLWRTHDWSCVAQVKVPSYGFAVTSIAFSPNGKVLCCATDRGTLFFFYMHDLVPAD